jgi:hypothetical protein
MLTAVLKAVKMLLSCCPKNSQDVVVLTALKVVQDAKKTTLTKIKYKDLFLSHHVIWLVPHFTYLGP